MRSTRRCTYWVFSSTYLMLLDAYGPPPPVHVSYMHTRPVGISLSFSRVHSWCTRATATRARIQEEGGMGAVAAKTAPNSEKYRYHMRSGRINHLESVKNWTECFEGLKSISETFNRDFLFFKEKFFRNLLFQDSSNSGTVI